ncbi:hypothetical protein QUF74_01650 [Candidatus Halobeggiatoa sp. HSG11]|nr:hypothetical protein [Candidatus Halobeggiatoa sp. HSG11]
MRYTPLICGLLLISSPAIMAEDVGDTPADAKNVGTRAKVKETLVSPQDIDFYSFKIRESREPQVDNSGNMTVAFSQKSPPGMNPNSGWKLELFSETDFTNVLYTAILPETSLEIEFQQGLSTGNYYYKVSSLDGAVYPTSEYSLISSWKTDEHYEKSPNDTPDDATFLRANETYMGNLSSAIDVDYFHFNLETADTVTITLNQDVPGIHSNAGWQFGLLSQGLVVDMPSTSQASNPLQVELGAGIHYLFVKSMPTDNLQAIPVGRTYKIKVAAQNATPPQSSDACPFIFIYAQNPATQHWATFPTPCDVPVGWTTQTEIPNSAKVCPSSNSSYKWPSERDGVKSPGKLVVPYLEFEDLDGGEYMFRVELNQEGEITPTTTAADFRFNVGAIKLVRTIKKPDVIIPDNAAELVENLSGNVDISVAAQ